MATSIRNISQQHPLDEASVLRSYGSKTYQTFLDKFKGVPYKLVATATPSPNKYKELIHYAGYLEIMDTGQALTKFFQRDSTKANNLTLYPSQEEAFWNWLGGAGPCSSQSHLTLIRHIPMTDISSRN